MNNLRKFVYVGNKAVVFYAENAIDGILINPMLPSNFDSTENEDRPKSHMKFWKLPFIHAECGMMHVLCLDGGAWDRPTTWGVFDSLDDAVNCAKSGPEWRK